MGDQNKPQPKASTTLQPLRDQVTGKLPVGPTEPVTKGGGDIWDRLTRADHAPSRDERARRE